MDAQFDSLFEFEQWFLKKLYDERERRELFIERVWNKLNPSDRTQLLACLDNDYLLLNQHFIIEKKDDDLYFVIKGKIGLGYEKIREWIELITRANN